LFAAARNSSVTANNNNNNQAAGSQSTNPDNNIINENEFPSLGARSENFSIDSGQVVSLKWRI